MEGGLALPSLGILVLLSSSDPTNLGAAGGAASPLAQTRPAAVLNPMAETYVRLVLAVGEHDPDYVDAYYGPEKWREEAKAAKRPLPEIAQTARSLAQKLQALDLSSEEEMVRLRQGYLLRQLQSLSARVEMLQGKKLTFDEESKALYDAVAPTLPESRFKETLGELDRILPGEGTLPERYQRFRSQFAIPRERLDRVFSTAIAEARRRTKLHIPLPEDESFTVEYVTGKSWSAYNWYKGNGRSVIQVNTDLPIIIDRAVDLAAHEGYPGHHVYNALLEQHLARERGWVEFTVYPLFSPQSLIAEGSANYGVEVAFPGAEHLAYVRDVLFPLSGLDPAKAELFGRVQKLVESLDYAGNEAARRYLDGRIGRAEAAEWLTRFALMPPDRAEQRTRFMDQYRSYVINYNLGRDMVRDYIEQRGGTADHPDRRWEEFRALLASPRLPSDLK